MARSPRRIRYCVGSLRFVMNSREDGFSNPRDHLDRHRRKHDAGHRRSDGRGRQNAKKQDDDAERTLVQGGQQPAKGEVIRRRLPEKVR